MFYQIQPFEATDWQIRSIPTSLIPSKKVNLGRFPTPIHPLTLKASSIDLWVKRDDLSSFDLSGNKVRKLEFLLAYALENGYDCVVTIGGEQSNHCRATALAARQLGLEPYLILRTKKRPDELTLTGNLLFNRAIGSTIQLVSPRDYSRIGSDKLLEEYANKLRKNGRNPFIIPMGGSNLLGSFGYMECVREILEQSSSLFSEGNQNFHHIVFACGSGGTAAGLAIGLRLVSLSRSSSSSSSLSSPPLPRLHGVGVCDDPDYFYSHIEEVCREMGLDVSPSPHPPPCPSTSISDHPSPSSNSPSPSSPLCWVGPVRDWVRVTDGKGRGYSLSTPEELSFLLSVARQTGLLFDPVYSGKALYSLLNHLVHAPTNPTEESSPISSLLEDSFSILPGQKVLFIHTGGTFGLYEKESELLELLKHSEQGVVRNESENGLQSADISMLDLSFENS